MLYGYPLYISKIVEKKHDAHLENLTFKAAEGFAENLASLRNSKSISSRGMSLIMGQAIGYENNIENCNNLPSLVMFFEICTYLGVPPANSSPTSAPMGILTWTVLVEVLVPAALVRPLWTIASLAGRKQGSRRATGEGWAGGSDRCKGH